MSDQTKADPDTPIAAHIAEEMTGHVEQRETQTPEPVTFDSMGTPIYAWQIPDEDG